MSQQHQHPPTPTGTVGDADGLEQRVRDENPSARELDKIAAAHEAHGGLRHRLWLDEQAGRVLFLEHPEAGSGPAHGRTLHEIPLRSASCTRVMVELTSAALARLASPTDSYQDRAEVDRDIGALVQLFRVQLARMRTEHTDPARLLRAVHAQIGRADGEEQAARRTAFLGWYLKHAYGDRPHAHDEAERDLGCDIEQGINTHLDARFVARTIMDWQWYRDRLRSQVPLPQLNEVPSDKKLRQGDLHWYYEFRTLGRHLTERQMLELRAELPWADVTSDCLVLDEWSDISEHPIGTRADEIVAQYFDAGLHFDQNGSRTLWLRLPATLADAIAPYQARHGWAVRTTSAGDDLVLELHREESDGAGSYLYYDPSLWLEELLPLRDDLAAGDVRAPAIAWRAANENFSFTKAETAPPMPDGLDEDELSPQLHALIHLLEEIP
ncbi:hypothetical protein [Streptomyces coerulescens]|uniref:Uncharacterized protein n=1 Tax=Streptomyces coerulescens TaxID=29304 RepID=A0ABW0CUK1_STRCD